MRRRVALAAVCSLAAIVTAGVPADAAKKPRSCKFPKEDKGCAIKSGGYATKPGQDPVMSLTMLLTPESRATLIIEPTDPCPGAPVDGIRFLARTKQRVTMGAKLTLKGTETFQHDEITATVKTTGTAKLVSGRKATTKGTATITFSGGSAPPPPCKATWSGTMRRV